MQKQLISTSNWHAEHPFAGQNTQQKTYTEGYSFCVWRYSKQNKTSVNQLQLEMEYFCFFQGLDQAFWGTRFTYWFGNITLVGH